MDQSLTQLFRHLAHELKRPLASLQQSVNLLLEEVSGPLTVEQRRILEIQRRTAQRVFSCITKLGDLADLKGGFSNEQLASQDLAMLIERVIKDFESRSKQQGVAIKVDLPLTSTILHCDSDLVYRAISYVLENAIEFSPSGGTVRIAAQRIAQLPSQVRHDSFRTILEGDSNPGYVVLTVADSGPGIAPSERETVFRQFYQIKKDPQAYQPGLGIGLTLCKGIVEAHHGAVWIDDTSGGGTLVSLLFPVATSSEAEPPAAETLAKTAR